MAGLRHSCPRMTGTAATAEADDAGRYLQAGSRTPPARGKAEGTTRLIHLGSAVTAALPRLGETF